jgi:hypothetical protein
MTVHRFVFGATQCVIQVREEPDASAPWVAEAVVVTEEPHALRWVGSRSGPLKVRGSTDAHALARMQGLLDDRFGPRGQQQPLPPWLFDVPIQPPTDDTSTVPIRLVWTDGTPDTLTTVLKREPQLELSMAGAGVERVAAVRLTGERDSAFRWIYAQLVQLLVSLSLAA